MRVLCVTSSYPTALNTIAGNFVEAQVKSLRKRGIQVDVIAANMFSLRDIFNWIGFKIKNFKTENEDCYFSGSIINLFPFGAWFHKFWFRKTIRKAIFRYFHDKGKPDLVHAHFSLWAGYAVADFDLLKDIPLILTEHSSVYFENKVSGLEQNCAALAVSKCDQIISISNFLNQSMGKYFKNMDTKITVIPNLVEDIFFESYDFDSKEKAIISVGRLVKSKGFDTLIEAFSKMKTPENHKLVIVGEGDEMTNLKTLAQNLEIDQYITFAGTLPKVSILHLIRKSALLVSTSHFETFGLSIAEALATGTPVLVTDVGAPSGFVNKEVGEVCKVADVNDTLMKLNFMFDNYSKYNHKSIREYAWRSFSEQSVSDKIIGVYSKVLHSN